MVCLTFQQKGDIMSGEKIVIDDKIKNTIEKALEKGNRVELIPVKDGVKIMNIKREELTKN